MLQRVCPSSPTPYTTHIAGLAITLTLLVGPSVQAASSHQHEAHVHGEGELNVAIDANDLQVELKVPSANVVGFEHTPRTDKQHDLVDAAMAKLVTSENWLKIQPAGACELEHVSVEMLGEHRTNDDAQASATAHGTHAESEHKHGHEKAHKEHDSKEHGHKEDGHKDHGHKDHDEESNHDELHAEYRFHCSDSVRPTALEVTLEAVLIDVHEVKATLLSATGQKVQHIDVAKTVLPLP